MARCGLGLVGLRLGAGLAAALLSSMPAAAEDFRATPQAGRVAEVATYRGPDRLQRLVEGARAEGELNVYTSFNLRYSQPLVEAFRAWLERTHGIRANVNLWRGGSEAMLQRVLLEARAGRFQVDAVEGNGPELEILKREGLTARFWSPSIADLPEAVQDADGFWQGTRLNIFTQAYNTRLVSPSQLPKTWEELLDASWRGRLGIEAGDWDWFATLVRRGPWGGEERALGFFRRLRDQQLQVRQGHTLISQLMAAGEIPLVLTVYNFPVEELKKDGAPVEWFVIEPAVVRPNGVAVAANAPHPHLAMLFVDFLLSERGQQVYLEVGAVPASRRIPSRLKEGFGFVQVDMAAIVGEASHWQRLWEQTLLR